MRINTYGHDYPTDGSADEKLPALLSNDEVHGNATESSDREELPRSSAMKNGMADVRARSWVVEYLDDDNTLVTCAGVSHMDLSYWPDARAGAGAPDRGKLGKHDDGLPSNATGAQGPRMETRRMTVTYKA